MKAVEGWMGYRVGGGWLLWAWVVFVGVGGCGGSMKAKYWQRRNVIRLGKVDWTELDQIKLNWIR